MVEEARFPAAQLGGESLSSVNQSFAEILKCIIFHTESSSTVHTS